MNSHAGHRNSIERAGFEDELQAACGLRLWGSLQDEIAEANCACNFRGPTNIWLAKAGFGGTEYLLSGVLSEGSKRGMAAS